MLNRLDQSTAPYLLKNARKIIVHDTGLPAYFEIEPPTEIEFHIGDSFFLPISEPIDPEGEEIVVNVVLRQATWFAYYAASKRRILIREDVISYKDIGEYKISLELQESVNRAWFKSAFYHCNLKVLPPRPEKWKNPAEVGVFARIRSITAKGEMKITFS